MFRKNKLALAVGIAAAALSNLSMACEAPSITKFTVNNGVDYGVATGILEGSVPSCNTGQFFPMVKLYDNSDVFAPQAVSGETFSIPFIIDGDYSNTGFEIYAVMKEGDPTNGVVISSTPNKYVGFGAPNFQAATKNTSISEAGGVLAQLPPGENCLITADPNQAARRDANYCLAEVSSPSNDAILSEDLKILVGTGTPGDTKTASWTISKLDQAGQKHVLATDSATASIQAEPLDLQVGFPAMVQATQPYSVRLAQPGAMLALTNEQAQAYSQAGTPGYVIAFDHLPPGISAKEVNGEIEISGRAMFLGGDYIGFTPKRVLADGTVFAQPGTGYGVTSTLPALGISVPATKNAEQFKSFELKPSFGSGLCAAAEVNSPSNPDEGGCYFEWSPTAPLTSDGITLSGSVSTAGTQTVPWRYFYQHQGVTLDLAAGSTNIVTDAATVPSPTIVTGQTSLALSATEYSVSVEGCSTQPTIEAALQAASSSGAAACVINAQFPEDYIQAPSEVPGQYSGTYPTAGQKIATFTAKKALPDGTIIDSAAVQKAVSVADHGMRFAMTAPTKIRAGKDVTAQISATNQACTLATDTLVANTPNTPVGERSCLLSIEGMPEGWTNTQGAITGTMGAQDATLNWTISYPVKVGEVVTSIEMAKGSNKISSYTPVVPEFKLVGRILGEGTLGVASRGDLGVLTIDTATPNLNLIAKFLDANGNTLLEIPRLSDNSVKIVRIPALGEMALMQQQVVNLQVAYADDDADVAATKPFTVLRMPEATPSVQVTAPKRVKLGETGTFTVSLGEGKSTGIVNDPARIGTWKLHLAKMNKDGSTVALTTPQAVTQQNGEVQIALEASTDWLGSNLVVAANLDTEIDALKKTVKTRSFVVQEYLWPSFDIEVRQPIAFAPSAIRLSLVPSDRRFLGQASERESKVTYTWRLPEAAVNARATGSMAFATFEQAGDYEIELDIEDINGNKSTVAKTITVAPPKPYNVDLKMYSANKWPGRAPASFALRPQISGGHPSDRVIGYTLKVNGTEVHNSAASPRILPLPDAGEYTIELSVASKMGAVGTVTKTISLAPNTPPACELTQKVYRGVGTVTMKCADSDGRMAGYTWNVDGVTKQLSRNYYSIPIADGGSTVEVTARDDAGGETTLSTTLTK